MNSIQATNIANVCFHIVLRRLIRADLIAGNTVVKYSKLAFEFIDQGDPAERLMALLLSLSETEMMYNEGDFKPKSTKEVLYKTMETVEAFLPHAKARVNLRQFI
jgi:hypothetical protein